MVILEQGSVHYWDKKVEGFGKTKMYMEKGSVHKRRLGQTESKFTYSTILLRVLVPESAYKNGPRVTFGQLLHVSR